MNRMPRTFVVDTNVLLHDPNALESFDEHDIVIPMTVIEEVDRFKKDLNETGRNARQTSRYLDALRQKGSLREGVALPGGGSLKVAYEGDAQEAALIPWGKDTNDNRILSTALRLHQQLGGNVALVTRDTNMRLKCDALGVVAEDYENARITIDDHFTGMTEGRVMGGVLAELYAQGTVAADTGDLAPNSFVVLRSEDDVSQSAMARVLPDHEGFKLVGRHKEGAWGIFARNKEQLFAMELLFDPDIKLVTLSGMAGTGKTLLAIAAGLSQTTDDSRYRRVLVSRPIFPLGRDIGFLPGDMGEKLNPWMKPIFDNLDYLLSSRPERGRRNGQPAYQYLLDSNLVEVEALTYIRGRSIPEQFLIIDEAQNLTPHEVKTVLTRAGEGTKIVLTGDPMQIDNPYVDEMSNGLTFAIERFKNEAISGHITLRKGERSELAELAAKLL